MRKYINGFRLALGLGIAFAIALTGGAILLSEQRSGADSDYFAASTGQLTEPHPESLARLEGIRSQYADIKSVEFDADVNISIFNGPNAVSGTGSLSYAAKDNKYKYSTTATENLIDLGLMRDVEVLFTGTKYYFYDPEAKIVSFQLSEEVRLSNAMPNPFFLPLDFLSNDDDSCENCKMRLQDINQPIRWPKRASTVEQLSSETIDGITHTLIEMSGGMYNEVPYKFRVRLIGAENSMKIVSLSRVKMDGSPLIEVICEDFRSVPNAPLQIPHRLQVAARGEQGNVTLMATYQLRDVKVNDDQTAGSFGPTFSGAEKYWNSDTKSFVQSLN